MARSLRQGRRPLKLVGMTAPVAGTVVTGLAFMITSGGAGLGKLRDGLDRRGGLGRFRLLRRTVRGRRCRSRRRVLL